MNSMNSKMSYATYDETPMVYAVPVPTETRNNQPIASSMSYRKISGRASDINERQLKQLVAQGFTTGLARSLASNSTAFPLRIWVIDNSGSMQKADGHSIVQTAKKNDVRFVECSRWDEIKECANYHIHMSALLEVPTSFRLLNDPGATVGPQQFDIGHTGPEMIQMEVQNAMTIMSRARPGGCTPLTRHIEEIYQIVQALAPQLKSEGKRVVIVLATDGLPTDEQGMGSDYVKQQFVQSLRLLEGLPVWVVIRLCTDETDVVDFYNGLDEQLELSMDVLDDFVGEAEEVYKYNKWFNYALPLHRLREMGFHDRTLDMIDERPLTRGEVRDFCALLFGNENFDGVPDPAADWTGFLSEVEKLLKKETQQWNPIKKKVTPWLDISRMHKDYGDESGCVVM